MSKQSDLVNVAQDAGTTGYVNITGDTMTGTLTLDGNISDGTTTIDPVYVINGSAKAWVNFNGNSGAVIRDSENISSTTDNATGNYTASFTNSLSDTNYCANVSVARGATATSAGSVSVFATSSAGIKASAALGAYGESLNALTFGDAEFICGSFMGDLA